MNNINPMILLFDLKLLALLSQLNEHIIHEYNNNNK